MRSIENTLKHNNLSLKDLYNPSVNIQMGAFILKSCIDKYQISNNALNCYNGKIKDNHYAFKVIKNLRVKQGQIIIDMTLCYWLCIIKKVIAKSF